jgi:catechol 2,3-dioxygenase-like lactoylglutathione lyase family enzyme
MKSFNSAGINDRRGFLGTVGAAGLLACTSIRTMAQERKKPKSTFQAVELNHVSLDVTRVERSGEFYQTVFGMTPFTHGRGARASFLHFKEGFLNLRSAESAGLNHFCLSIEEFDVDSVYKVLSAMELKPWVQGGGRLLHVYDPDGINVQIQETGHGWQRTRNQLTNADKGTFATVRLHHLTLNVTDVARSCDFYREMFGLHPVAVDEGGERCILGVGQSFLELRKAENPGMHHHCYAITDFDASSAAGDLAKANIKVIDSDETGSLAFHDPQDLLLHVRSADRGLS